jgi:hypothetical protein
MVTPFFLLQIREHRRAVFDSGNEQGTAACPLGIHQTGRCTCDSFLVAEESSARASISRIVMLTEALFEVFFLLRSGQGFGGFLDLCEKVFFLIQCPGAVLPPAGRVFFFFCVHFIIININILYDDDIISGITENIGGIIF